MPYPPRTGRWQRDLADDTYLHRFRHADVVRIGLGTTLLARPSLPGTLTATSASPRARWIVRLLGARMLAQGAVGLAGRTWTPALDATIEATHALTMLPLVRRSPATARPAVLSALSAASFAIADLRAWRSRDTAAAQRRRGTASPTAG